MLFPRIKELFAWRKRLFQRFWRNRGYRWAATELIKTRGDIDYVLNNAGPPLSQFREGVMSAVSHCRSIVQFGEVNNYSCEKQQVLAHNLGRLKWIDCESHDRR